MASSVRSARCPDAGSAGGGLYRPRSPRTSPLWQCARRHAAELRASSRASGQLRGAVEQQVIERFIACGDPHEGFARIYCDTCRHEFLLAYSCKTRYFSPELPPETRAPVQRMGRAERPRARGTPAVRVHPAQAPAPDLQPSPDLAGRAVPHRRAPADLARTPRPSPMHARAWSCACRPLFV